MMMDTWDLCLDGEIFERVEVEETQVVEEMQIPLKFTKEDASVEKEGT
jgi:hypothetical protein